MFLHGLLNKLARRNNSRQMHGASKKFREWVNRALKQNFEGSIYRLSLFQEHSLLVNILQTLPFELHSARHSFHACSGYYIDKTKLSIFKMDSVLTLKIDGILTEWEWKMILNMIITYHLSRSRHTERCIVEW